MSVNAVTVNSITDNLITVLSAISGFTFESDKIDARLHTWVQLNIKRDNEEENFGESPQYVEQDYEIIARREITDKDDHRETGAVIKWTIKEAITVDLLNIGDLASSKLISRVSMDSDVNDYNSAEGLQVLVNLTVRYRDLRS